VNEAYPVILLGAGRSGTTLLYKLLSAHPDIAYLSNYQSRWPACPHTAIAHRMLRVLSYFIRTTWFKKEGGAYFNKRRAWLQSLVPTPAEAESVYRACGLPLSPQDGFVPDSKLVLCLNNRFEKIRLLSGAKVLLTKRTANNRRIAQLTQIFPRARYIHLVRDGRAVAYSLPRVAWWDDHTLYWADASPKDLIARGADPIELAATNWVAEMNSLERGISLIKPEYVFLARYEELLENPVAEIGRMLEFIGLGGGMPIGYRKLIDSLLLRPREESWVTAWSEEEKRRVINLQFEQLRRYGYV